MANIKSSAPNPTNQAPTIAVAAQATSPNGLYGRSAGSSQFVSMYVFPQFGQILNGQPSDPFVKEFSRLTTV